MNKLGKRGVSRVRDFKLKGVNPRQLTASEIVNGKFLDFREKMANRILVGTCRYADMYGDVTDTVPQTGNQLLHDLLTKIAIFMMTRNHEMLIDVANYAALLANYDDHPDAYFNCEDQGEAGYSAVRDKASKLAREWAKGCHNDTE